MTPEQISKIRNDAGTAFLQRTWEFATQCGMSALADAAEAQAKLAESEAQLQAANAKIAELTPKPAEPIPN